MKVPFARALMRLSSIPARLSGRTRRVVVEEVDGVPVIVLPQVFNPKLFRSGALLASAVRDELVHRPVQTMLDLGCGSGVCGVFAARLGARVTAVDINPAALHNARTNAVLHGFEDRFEAVQSDVFAELGGRRFGLVTFNPPFYEGTPDGLSDAAWRGEGVVRRFVAGLPDHLEDDGTLLLGTSSEGVGPVMVEELGARGMSVECVAHAEYTFETMWVHRVRQR